MMLYRPSNGTEGLWFMERWCDHCTKDTKSKPCRILGRTMAFEVTDRSYPRAWIEDEDGPRCTAFSDRPKLPLTIIRDKRQIAMPFDSRLPSAAHPCQHESDHPQTK